MKKYLYIILAISCVLGGCVKDVVYVDPGKKEDPQKDDPNKDDPTPGSTATIYINEISTGDKLFEIYNAGSAEADITGYVFTKDGKDTWTVPASKGKIPAKGFVVYKAKQADAEDGAPFGLSGTKGFKLELADKDGKPVDAVDNLTSVTTIEDSETYGRKVDGVGSWVVFSVGTMGASNAGGTIKDGGSEPEPEPEAIVVLNELDGNAKFIELYNAGNKDADLSGWQLQKDGEGAKWIGPAGWVLKAGEFRALDCVKKSENYETDFGAGFSAAKNVQIILVDNNGVEIDRFERGTETGGWGNISLPSREESFSRVPDGTGPFVYAASTKGAPNGSKVADIEQE